MESTPLTSIKAAAPTSFLMEKRAKPETNTPLFMQALAQATQTFTSHTIKAEPANLARNPEPRCHLQLTTLNPVQTHYAPEPAALERAGASRMVPFTVGG